MRASTVYSLGATKEGAEKACINGAFQPTSEDSLRVLEGLRKEFATLFEDYRVFALAITVGAVDEERAR